VKSAKRSAVAAPIVVSFTAAELASHDDEIVRLVKQGICWRLRYMAVEQKVDGVSIDASQATALNAASMRIAMGSK
jgi:hypothetical protein